MGRDVCGRSSSRGRARLLVPVADESLDDFTVVAAEGATEEVVGRTIALRPSGTGSGTGSAHRSYEVPASRKRGWPDPPRTPRRAPASMSGPLFMRDELSGLLVVGSTSQAPESARDALEALSSQVALALESAALTEDLLRRQSEARFRRSSRTPPTSSWSSTRTRRSATSSPSVARACSATTAASSRARSSSTSIHPDDKTGCCSSSPAVAREHDDHPAHRVPHAPPRRLLAPRRDGRARTCCTTRTSRHRAQHPRHRRSGRRSRSSSRTRRSTTRSPAWPTGRCSATASSTPWSVRPRDGRPVSVLFMDLDDFKTVNDSLGHAAGDLLLGEVGERLRSCLRTGRHAARLGGDEFAVLLEDAATATTPPDVAERMLDALDGAVPARRQGGRSSARASASPSQRRRRRDGRRRGAAAQRRRRDVHGQGSGQGPLPALRAGMHDAALRRLRAEGRPAARRRQRRVRPALPADRRAADRRASPASRRWSAGSIPSAG